MSYDDYDYEYKRPAPKPAPKKKKKKSKAPLILVLLVLAVGLVVLLLKSCGGDEDATPTQPKGPQPVVGPTGDYHFDGLYYTDDRAANYVPGSAEAVELSFQWTRQNGHGQAQVTLSTDRGMYEYYKSLARYFSVDEYSYYLNDANNRALVGQIVAAIRKENGKDLSASAMARECAQFVQGAITYELDGDTAGMDEYPRYPIETLFEGRGDCEDSSILLAAMLKELGYDVGFLLLPDHLAVALRTADDYTDTAYYEINGHRYLYIESTGEGFNIGDIPEDMQGVEASFHPVP